MRTELGIFLKTPRAGRVKTRLAGTLGPDGAASLYGAFLLDVLTLARRACERHGILVPRLHHADDPPAHFLPALERAHGVDTGARDWPTHAQGDGDLGARLDRAFAAAAGRGCALLVLGTDSPDLPATHLDRALRTLDDGADAVFGAAADGGVWCIGLRHAPEGFFDDLPWSRDNTGEALRSRARAHGYQPHEVDPWYDCDEEDDLLALADRLRRQETSATMTERWLRDRRGDWFTDPSPTSRP